MKRTKNGKEKKESGIVLRLIREARPIYGYLLFSCFLSLLIILLSIAVPLLLGELIDRLYALTGAGKAAVTDAITAKLALLLGAYVLYNVLTYAKMQLMNRVVSRYFTCALRIRISDKIKRLPVSFVDKTPVGDILNRMTDDVSTMGNYIHQIIDVMTTGLLQIVAIAVMMFLENPLLAALVLALTPFSIWLSSFIAAKSEAHFHAMFSEAGNLTAVVEEAFTNFATTKAYNLEEFTNEKHRAVNERQRKALSTASFMESMVQPIIAFTNALAYIGISLLGGWLLVRNRVSVGVVVTIVLYAKRFSTPLEQIAGGFGSLRHATAASRRVFRLLDLPEEENAAGTLPVPTRGAVRFEHVDFSYDPQAPLIEDLNMDIRPGQNIAIVGPTGAGKTTIVNLLMRFYDINRGRILLDGTDIAAVSREETRARFGMVLQDTWLFGGTIAENVAYGRPDATREEIERACDEAYCDHFIRTLPQGYDTVIGDDSTNLSGGQKQLLTIARALLANHDLLILDEATSNVDTRTEILIQKAMDKLMQGKTCFVIAHRLSTIVGSDLILVLNHGKIVEQGTHTELLKKKGFYYQIYNSQYAI